YSPHGPERADAIKTVREFEVLVALCKASPILSEKYLGEKLARQLSPYLLEVHVQELEPSPFFRNIEPSPGEVLTSHLTTALLSLGINHSSLQETVKNNIWVYLDCCQLTASDLVSRSNSHNDIKDAIEIATITVSIIGFLDAAASHANFWSYEDRLCLIERVKLVLSQDFLVVVEKSLSTIHNSQTPSLQLREWKRYVRLYASTGRPLGAMLLQRSFVWLLVATTSLLSVEVDMLVGKDILDLRLSDSSLFKTTFQIGSTESEAIETLANIASDQITLLEDEADYLRLGSVWQQRLAYSTKAGALISYLNCILYDDNAADVGSFMAWLEICLADPIQMADKTLASVVLRSLALISRSFTAFAPSVSRILPRFIIQGSTSSQSIAVASSCLAIVLQLLSHDAIISTIYTLGNVLSSGWTTDRTLSANLNAELGLDGNGNNFLYEEKHPSISSIVLAANTEEESLMIYGNIVKAICSIAIACNDSKITALAQSMLLQKIDKVNKSIDARIITEASGLALSGGPLEFRSLLKLYAKMTTEGINQKNDALLLAILKGRDYLSTSLHRDSPLFDIYLRHLLEAIISKGDLHQVESTREADVEFAAREIEQLLNPLAILMSNSDLASLEDLDEDIFSLIRDSWFNIVVHGFVMNTERGTKYLK
ncbi:Phosphatidylinositol-4-kinase, partial [Blumeria graminis f. sp. tritici 96224]